MAYSILYGIDFRNVKPSMEVAVDQFSVFNVFLHEAHPEYISYNKV
jgi:hypothetical protein